MNVQDRIAKLNSLLLRVTSRPRRQSPGDPPRAAMNAILDANFAAPAKNEEPEEVFADDLSSEEATTTTAAAAEAALGEHVSNVLTLEGHTAPSSEISSEVRPAPVIGTSPGAQSDGSIEVTIDVDPDSVVVKAAAEPRYDSSERLVAAPKAQDQVMNLPEPLPPMRPESFSETIAVDDLDIVEEIPDDEEPPASSRRPVTSAGEQLEQIAFSDEAPRQPPRHTPPPESGRLPAAPLVEFDADVTGVREALPIDEAPTGDLTSRQLPEAADSSGQDVDELLARDMTTPPSNREPMPSIDTAIEDEEPIVSHVELSAVVTHAALEPGTSVAEFSGTVNRFEPASFGDLLDASLSL